MFKTNVGLKNYVTQDRAVITYHKTSKQTNKNKIPIGINNVKQDSKDHMIPKCDIFFLDISDQGWGGEFVQRQQTLVSKSDQENVNTVFISYMRHY